ncbi:GNAT family N-acetyltransferase [Methylobacillus flagellatus]|uniref:GNAT family N-acetyltransferase n=1 Tax=Methylobacillus flagellatus TaxID=405 RepID=UPI0010FA1AB1|nr:GNAT family N-acetyltransferase [Methylobacillus flagellatus]
MTSRIKPTPWDTLAFGMPCGELLEYSEAALAEAVTTPGLYSIKVDPLCDKHWLYDYGFYYCDTLLTPRCKPQQLQSAQHADAHIALAPPLDEVLDICHGAFTHGRFHRDFHIDRAAADLRYDNWLKQLHTAANVYGLYWQQQLAGFIAVQDTQLVLHALAEQQRGRGRAKYWWSLCCEQLFADGAHEISSSVSASNLAVVNLYRSLGFRFDDAVDVYHRLST